MQEIPGFGVVRSDNPIVAEVLRMVALDTYPEGTAEGNLPQGPEESRERLLRSELLESVGGIDLVMDFAGEVSGLNIHPLELILAPRENLGAAFCIGVQIGVALARRAANAPEIQ
jgi:hypothetical protein